MLKQKEILNELKVANVMLQIIAIKLDSLILLSKSKKLKSTQKKEAE
jgi:hypothetical protein